MPIAIVCPGCSQSLKVPDRMAGGKGKCPKCGTILRIPAAASSEEETSAHPTAPKPRPSQSAIQEEKAVRTRQRAAEEARADDDSEPAEDEESAPVARKKKKRKKSPALLYGLIGGGCFALLLVCSGIGGLAWWYFFSGGIDDDLKFMPNNPQLVASVQWDELIKSDVFKEVRREVPDIERGMNNPGNQGIGLTPDEVESIVIGVGSGSKDVMMVIHTKKAIDTNDLRARFKNASYKEAKAGKYTFHEPQDTINPAFCVVDKKRIVIGDKGSMRSVLERGKKPDFSTNMEAALKQADFKKTIAVAIDAKTGRNTMGGVSALGGQEILGTLEKTNGIVVQAKIAADVRFEITFLCQDATSANDVKKLLDGFLVMGKNNKSMPQELRDLMELNLKVDGNKVTGGNTFKVGPLIRTVKQQKGMF